MSELADRLRKTTKVTRDDLSEAAAEIEDSAEAYAIAVNSTIILTVDDLKDSTSEQVLLCVERFQAEIERLRGALQDIAEPMQMFERLAAKDGSVVDSRGAVRLMNDAVYLRGIAGDALKEVADE